MKALVGAFNQEKALVGAFSMIVKSSFAALVCGLSAYLMWVSPTATSLAAVSVSWPEVSSLLARLYRHQAREKLRPSRWTRWPSVLSTTWLLYYMLSFR